MMNEVNDSEPWMPFDQAWQLIQLASDRVGIYRWAKRTFSSEGDSPPSLGWGNIQEQVFLETQEKHPSALAGAHWSDMIGDTDLAIQVIAYRVRDLLDFVGRRPLSPAIRHRYSTEELGAAGYRIGEGELERAISFGVLGQSGGAYATETMRNFQEADQIICRSGYWACR